MKRVGEVEIDQTMLTCTTTTPQSNVENNAVLIGFYLNDLHGTPGTPCPVPCENTIAENWYEIADAADTCLQVQY
jgi:hypothetical protein